MKKLINPINLMCLTLLFLSSCQSNQRVTVPKSEIKNITFQDNVVHGDFEILDFKDNQLLGKLVLTNLQIGRVSFNSSGIIFKNKGQRGKLFHHSGDKLFFESNPDDRIDKVKKEHFEYIGKIPFQNEITLEENDEKEFIFRVEFGQEVSEPKDVKVLLNILYKQLLSRN